MQDTTYSISSMIHTMWYIHIHIYIIRHDAIMLQVQQSYRYVCIHDTTWYMRYLLSAIDNMVYVTALLLQQACPLFAYLGQVPNRQYHVTVGHEGHSTTAVVVGSCAPVVDQDLLGRTRDFIRGRVEVDLHSHKTVVLLTEQGLNQAVIFEPVC